MKERYFDPNYALIYTHFSDAFPPGGFFKEVLEVGKWNEEKGTKNIDMLILDARDCTNANLEDTDRAYNSWFSGKLENQLTRSKLESLQILILVDPVTETGQIITERVNRIRGHARQDSHIYYDIGELKASIGLPDNYQMPRDSRRQIPIE